MTNIEYACTLRRLAEIYEAHENLKLPFHGTVSPLVLYVHDRIDLDQVIAAFGGGDKVDDGNTIKYLPYCVGAFNFEIHVFKSGICERVRIGKKTIPAEEEKFYPAQPEKEEEIYAWKCSPLTKDLEIAAEEEV